MNPAFSDLLGYAAACLVFATFYARSITALRTIAIASNVMFIAYAVTAHLTPVLILHALLLPLNVWRLRQDLGSLTRRIKPPSISYRQFAGKRTDHA